MFKLEFGAPAWSLRLSQDQVEAECRVVLLGTRAIVKLPPNRALCEMARNDWHAIAAEVKRQTGCQDVIAGEE